MNVHLLRRWVVASTVGWLLGLVLAVAGAIVVNLAGASEGLFYLGVGMGAGVGYMQTRLVSQTLGVTSSWGWATMAGMSAPFVVTDVVRAIWTGLPFVYALWLSAACGGLLVGLLQRPMLPVPSRHVGWWVPASAGGWALAAATVWLYGAVPGVPSGAWTALVNTTAMPLGGVLLGVATGGVLTRILKR